MKTALKQVAQKDHRTVSNLTFRILQSWLEENGHIPEERQD